VLLAKQAVTKAEGMKNYLVIGGSRTESNNHQVGYIVPVMCSEMIKHIRRWTVGRMEDTRQLHPTMHLSVSKT